MSSGESQHREPVRGRHGFFTLAVSLAVIAAGMPARAHVAGRLDPSFAVGGLLVDDLAGDDDAFDSLAVQPDGGIVLSGSAGLLRLDASGAIDASFTAPGVQGRIVLQPDGRIVVLGRDGLTRLRGDGTLDTGFGQGGLAPLVDAFRAAGSEARALARQPNGKLVVGGVIGNQVALARWDSRGDLDRGFGDDGLVRTPAAPGGSRVEAITPTPENGVMVAGIGRPAPPAAGERFLIARYLADGRLDASFGSGGIVTTDLGGAAWATSLARLADGRVVAGGVDRGAAGDVLIVRYRTDGTLDPSFGRGGVVASDLGEVPDPLASLVLTPAANGTIVAAHVGGGRDACGVTLLRYRADGTLDPGFGSAGIARDDAGSCDVSLALALDAQGRIVTSGVRKGARLQRAIVERRFAGTCGDGVIDPEEDCDGGGCPASCCIADADGDGRCDAVDPCSVPAPVERARLQATRGRGGRVLGGKLRMSGIVTLADSLAASIDPVGQGVRVLIGDTFDVTLPAGGYDSSIRSGWIVDGGSRSSRHSTYRDGSGVPLDGVSRLVLRETTDDGVRSLRLDLRSGEGRWDALVTDDPVTATLVFAPAEAPRRCCGEVTFADAPDLPHCRTRRSGAGISCR